MPKANFPLRFAVFLATAISGSAAHQGWAADAYAENPGREGNGDFTIGPKYQIDPDLTDKGNPKGKSFEFSMPLAESKIFKGDDTTLTARQEASTESAEDFCLCARRVQGRHESTDSHYS